MNDILKYNEILNIIKEKQKELLNIFSNDKEIKKAILLFNDIKELELLKKKIEPIYFENVMKNCNHLFIKAAYKHKEWNNSNKYILFIDHYCLKCGCTTKNLAKDYLEINNISSVIVNHNKQLEIIENSKKYQVIDCGESNIYDLIILWEKLKQENHQLDFRQKVKKFFKIVMRDQKTAIKDEEKVYEFKYL